MGVDAVFWRSRRFLQLKIYITSMTTFFSRFSFGWGFTLATLSLAFLQSPAFASGLVKQRIDSTDYMITLANYDRGFYTPQVLHIKP